MPANRTEPGYVLKSELARLCLPVATRDSDRLLAWANSICIVFLLIGICGLPPARGKLRPVAPVEDIMPVELVQPDLVPPPKVQELKPEESPQEKQEVEPVVSLTRNTPDILFSVPTIGNLVVPSALAAAPPLLPMVAPRAVAAPVSRRAETVENCRRGYVLPDLAAIYQRDSAALTKRIQKHFEVCGVRTQVEGTGFVMVKGEDGEDEKQHSGKRAIVEVGFHSLRHTFVSLCREAGAPLSVVESIVGHSSPAMTRHYTHTGEAAARSAIAMLPGLKEEAPPNPKRTPAARQARLLANLRKMRVERVKRAVLRILAAVKLPAQEG